MNYNTLIRTASLLLLTAGALLTGACSKDKESEPTPPPTLDIDKGEDVPTGSMRLISYNILEGMKGDKPNNFDNFVAWVTEQNPDIFATQETNNFTQEAWSELAKRWGHNYAIICKENGYPVAITSKHPIELVNRMLEAPVYHGALHLKVGVYNVVVLHLYPFDRYPNDNSGEAGSGEAYRVKELNYILDQTIRNPQYIREPYWLMMGDFNSFSPLDEEEYKAQKRTLLYDVHKQVLANGYTDILRMLHPYFISSTSGGKSRIDYVYTSKSLANDVTSCMIVKDAFTSQGAMSDHLPYVVDFRCYPKNLNSSLK